MPPSMYHKVFSCIFSLGVLKTPGAVLQGSLGKIWESHSIHHFQTLQFMFMIAWIINYRIAKKEEIFFGHAMWLLSTMQGHKNPL